MAWEKFRSKDKGDQERDITVASPVSSTSDSPTLEKSHTPKPSLSTHQQDITEPSVDISQFEKSHQWDPNLPQSKLDALHTAAQTGDAEAVHEIEVDFVEHSPYEEVRAAVRVEDGEEVANTVRAWILGMLFVTVGSGANMFLSMRSPAINFPAIVAQL